MRSVHSASTGGESLYQTGYFRLAIGNKGPFISLQNVPTCHRLVYIVTVNAIITYGIFANAHEAALFDSVAGTALLFLLRHSVSKVLLSWDPNRLVCTTTSSHDSYVTPRADSFPSFFLHLCVNCV